MTASRHLEAAHTPKGSFMTRSPIRAAAPGLAQIAGRASALIAVLAIGGFARAQQEQPDVPLLQKLREPAEPPPAETPLEEMATPPAEEPLPVDLAPPTADAAVYPITRFVLEYGRPAAEGGEPFPDLDDPLFRAIKVKLGKDELGFVAPREGLETVEITLGDDLELESPNFMQSAINQVCLAVVSEFNRRGIYAVVVAPSVEDIDEGTGEDLRVDTTEFRLLCWIGVVAKVRTTALGDRDLGDPKINNPAHARIIQLSPTQPGALLRKEPLDDFAHRLNRHPGRRVDVAVAAADDQGGVQIDYLVGENKPWTLYAQLSNTGTENTDIWRERFGFVHNQLTGNDDILSLDFSTAGFESSSTFDAQYEFAIIPQELRMRVYGDYNSFTASDVGQAGQNFQGEGYFFGGELIWNVYQRGPLFVDLVGGAKYQFIRTTNEATLPEPTTGHSGFFLPYGAVRLERNTDAARTFAQVQIEGNLPGVANTNKEDLDELGRPFVDESFTILSWDMSQSFYLEPLFNPTAVANMTLAHELAFSYRGQQAFDSRLVPNFEGVVGGLYTVRGYPESVVAGDSTYVLSAEYRFHLPQALSQREPGKFFGQEFRYAPQTPYGRADWDLILRAFFDYGYADQSGAEPFETNESLAGTGVGFELQILNNVNIRLDWGFALMEVNSDPLLGGTFVSEGSNRVHFSATFLY